MKAKGINAGVFKQAMGRYAKGRQPGWRGGDVDVIGCDRALR